MKRFLLLAGLLAGASAAQAQITLENTYTSEAVYPFKLSTGEVKYAAYSIATSQVNIYNLDHSIFRQIPGPVVSGVGSYVDVLNVSDKLFNLTPDVECLIAVYNGATSQNTVYVLGHTGTQLLQIANSAYAEAVNTASGTKLLAYTININQTRVYAVPGTAVALKNKDAQDLSGLAAPFPNPTSERVQLAYSVRPGEVATLEVTDATGRQVKSFQVNSAFDNVMMDVRGLRSGVYLYRVTKADGTSSTAQRFIVR